MAPDTGSDPYDGLSLGPGPKDGDPYMTTGYLLTLIRTDKGMHIDILATASALLLGFLALLGSYRRRSGSKAFLLPLEGAYTLSYLVVSYTIGLIQSFDGDGPNPASSPLLWAVVLLLLLGSADTISAFSRHDVEQSKGMQANHTLQTLLVLWLLLSRRSLSGGGWIFAPFLLLCWLYSIFKMAQRIKALRMASSAHGLVRSAKVVADYMKATTAAADGRRHNPTDMTGYRYLVLGEEDDRSWSPPCAPHYLTKVLVDGGSKVVTIDMIWKHDGGLLRPDGKRARALKETCLSFALFKLLKRRFCGLEIAEAGHPTTRKFVLKGLLADHKGDPGHEGDPVHDGDLGHEGDPGHDGDLGHEGDPGHNGDLDHERAFRVVEVELSFMYDFFYTKYPALFPAKRVLGVVRFFFLGVVLVVLLFYSIIAVAAAKNTENLPPYTVFTEINNFLFIAIIVAIDVMQQLATRYSKWAVVHFVCGYVRRTEHKGWRYRTRAALLRWVAARKTRHWDHKLGQYSLLESLDYNPYITNALSWLTMGLMEPTGRGRKRGKDVQLPDQVKKAVAEALRRCLLDKTGGGCRLTNGVHSLNQEEYGDLSWACSLPTSTHTVLVWHIATTMCNVEDAATAADADEGPRRLVATSLSGYCAYLLAFVPGMLPDHSYAAKQTLDAVLEEARQHLGCARGMPERCSKMVNLGAAAGYGSDQDTPILNLGARLGRRLLELKRELRWELLADFWAELVLFLAPSENADVHAEYLARGGEFITHLWALLTHAGILKRPDFPDPAV